MQWLFMLILSMTAIFLILLVLVQRGRGGGLTGALGGMGGQSAFGSKAGDLFTRITIGVAAFWILLSVLAIKALNTPENVFGNTTQTTFDTAPAITGTGDREKSPSSESIGAAGESSREPAGGSATGDAAKSSPGDSSGASAAPAEPSSPAAAPTAETTEKE